MKLKVLQSATFHVIKGMNWMGNQSVIAKTMRHGVLQRFLFAEVSGTRHNYSVATFYSVEC